MSPSVESVTKKIRYEKLSIVHGTVVGYYDQTTHLLNDVDRISNCRVQEVTNLIRSNTNGKKGKLIDKIYT